MTEGDMQVVACVTCGNQFSQRNRTTVNCSRKCWYVAYGRLLAAPLPERLCALAECTAVFQPKRDGQRCCSEKHGKLLCNRERRADGRDTGNAWTDARRDADQRRRARKRGASTGRPVLFSEIADRDGWICQLCSDPVYATLKWPHALSASLDHVRPLSVGGIHDPDNVQLSHLGCNTAKGNRVTL